MGVVGKSESHALDYRKLDECNHEVVVQVMIVLLIVNQKVLLDFSEVGENCNLGESLIDMETLFVFNLSVSDVCSLIYAFLKDRTYH